MSVIAEVRVPAGEFSVGRSLRLEEGTAVEFERVVPGGTDDLPVFSFAPSDGPSLLERFRAAEGVGRLDVVEVFDDHTLYTLEWSSEDDPLFAAVTEQDGHVLRGVGTADRWEFELRFPSHESLSAFREACADHDLSLGLERVYSPSATGSGPWVGLTHRQRTTLELAVERGYYDIPRRCTTIELADELGISDQAVTERLRRGIVTFVTNTLLDDGS